MIDVASYWRDLGHAENAGEPEEWTMPIKKADLRALLRVYRGVYHDEQSAVPSFNGGEVMRPCDTEGPGGGS
jgi:hypothetical protein